MMRLYQGLIFGALLLMSCDEAKERAQAVGADGPQSVGALSAQRPVALPECAGSVHFAMIQAQGVPKSDMPEDQLLDAELLEELAGLYRHRYGIDAKVVAPIEVPSSVYVPAKKQVVAERMLERMGQVHKDDDAVLIGVLNEDMRLDSEPRWNYGFSFRLENTAVVSGYRMGEKGLFRNASTFRHRMRVMMSKNVAVLRCGFGQSSNPKSVVFSNVMGPKDLDRMEFDLLSGRR